MLGAGSEYWLPQNLRLKATIQSVQMKPGDKRSWYGMMHIVPQTTIIQKYPEPKTFMDMRSSMDLSQTPVLVDSTTYVSTCIILWIIAGLCLCAKPNIPDVRFRRYPNGVPPKKKKKVIYPVERKKLIEASLATKEVTGEENQV